MARKARSEQQIEIDRAVGSRLKAIRQERGLSLRQAAEAAGLGPNHLRRFEEGVHGVTVFTLLRVCDAYGVTPNDVLLDAPDAQALLAP